MANKNKTTNRSVISLFSGCGGMDLGFEGDFDVLKRCVNTNYHPDWIAKDHENGWIRLKKTPFDTIFANDIRPDAKVAWVNFFSNRRKSQDTFRLESIVDLVKRARQGERTIFPIKPDVITGGFPCQDFSLAGKRLGFNSRKGHHGGELNSNDEPTSENRGLLYMWMREVIEIAEPNVFIAENVKGLITLKDAKTTIENDFKKIGNGGYIVQAKVLCTSEFGVPQNRERIFFIGLKKKALKKAALDAFGSFQVPSTYDPYPEKTHCSMGYEGFMGGCNPFVTVAEALDGLEEPELSMDLSQQAYSKASYLKKGQGQVEVKNHAPAPTIRAEHHGNIEYRRLSLDHGGKHLDELDRGLPERRLSVRECARLQTFPDDYEFVIKSKIGDKKLGLSGSDSYKLIGNAVPPFMGYCIAMRLAEIWPRLFKASSSLKWC
jgi:DNA (cytosine-5)-methyltransferase 1